MINIVSIYMYTDYHSAIIKSRELKQARLQEEEEQIEIQAKAEYINMINENVAWLKRYENIIKIYNIKL